MVNLESIVAALAPLVVLEQTYNPDNPKLATSLVLPTSSRLCYHPLLSAENLDAISPAFDIMNWEPWAAGVYAVGATVSRLETHWTSNADIVAADVPGTSAKWEERNKLSEYLIYRRNQAVRTAITSMMNAKKASGILREQLNSTMLYEGAGSMNDLIIKKNRLVGFEIQVLNNNGLKAVLKQLSLQLSGVDTFKIYLWHSSQIDPISNIEITHSDAYSVKWYDLPINDFTLRFRDPEFDSGFFYLGYYEEDITNQAINKVHNLGTVPCGTCSNYNRSAFTKYSQYVKIRAFQVTSPPADQKLWDLRHTVYVNDTNFGMNLRLDAECDLTDYIIARAGVFADLVMEQLKYDLILEIANSTRSNVLSEQVKLSARAAIQDKHLGGEGLTRELGVSREAASLEFSDIERNVCAPQQKPKGVRSANIHIRR